MTVTRFVPMLAASIIVLPASLLHAQAAPEREEALGDESTAVTAAPPVTGAAGSWDFSLRTGYEFQFEEDIDGGGEFDVGRARLSLGARTRLGDKLSLGINSIYNFDQYDFGGMTSFGGSEPWEDIHTLRFGVSFSYELDNDWTIFGGPVVRFSRESGADWNDSDTWGGTIGARHRVNDGLVLGLGVGVVEELEDDTRVFPLIIVDWEITDDLRLQSASPVAAGRPHMELVWDLGEGWTVGAGAAYFKDRFRLDDDGTAPDGIGEETRMPVWVRVTYELDRDFKVNLYGGFVNEGSLQIENERGSKIGDQDYDTATMIGIAASLRF